MDECHRYASEKIHVVKALSLMKQKSCTFRTLALSATPGPSKDKIQAVITNLSISKLIYYDEEDEDVKPYLHSREIVVKEVSSITIKSEAHTINKMVNSIFIQV